MAIPVEIKEALIILPRPAYVKSGFLGFWQAYAGSPYFS